MIDTSLITDQVIEDRYVKLPEVLVDALEDEATSQAVIQICNDHHIQDKDRITIITQLVALVLMGFIHDYDLGSEINSALNFTNPQLGQAIAEIISAKIFKPLQMELARNYKPVVPPAAAPAPLPAEAPAAMADIKSPAPEPKPMSPLTFHPAQTSDQSYSPLPSSPAPKTATPAPSAIPQPAVSTVASTGAKPAAAPGAAPAPVMLHQETEFKPAGQIANTPNIRPAAQLPGKGAISMFSAAAKPFIPKPSAAPSPVTAKIQIGQTPTSSAPQPTVGRTEYTAPRIVNYSAASQTQSGFGAPLPAASAPPTSPKPLGIGAFPGTPSQSKPLVAPANPSPSVLPSIPNSASAPFIPAAPKPLNVPPPSAIMKPAEPAQTIKPIVPTPVSVPPVKTIPPASAPSVPAPTANTSGWRPATPTPSSIKLPMAPAPQPNTNPPAPPGQPVSPVTLKP